MTGTTNGQPWRKDFMSSAHKEHLKALKGPDQFQATGIKAVKWLTANPRLLAMLIAPVAVVAIAFFGFQTLATQRKSTRLEDLGKISAVYDSEARVASDQRQVISKKIQDIEAKLAPKGDAQTPVAATPAQLDEKAALEKQAQAIKADHTASAQQFLNYYKTHDDNAEGWVAGMTAARVFIAQGKPTEAQPILEGVLAKSKSVRFYQVQSRITLVGLLEQSGEYDKALTQVDDLEKAVEADLKPMVLLTRGRLQLLKNDKATAKTTLSNLIDSYGSSAEAQKARTMLALLNA